MTAVRSRVLLVWAFSTSAFALPTIGFAQQNESRAMSSFDEEFDSVDAHSAEVLARSDAISDLQLQIESGRRIRRGGLITLGIAGGLTVAAASFFGLAASEPTSDRCGEYGCAFAGILIGGSLLASAMPFLIGGLVALAVGNKRLRRAAERQFVWFPSYSAAVGL